jgi:hypothetical protein
MAWNGVVRRMIPPEGVINCSNDAVYRAAVIERLAGFLGRSLDDTAERVDRAVAEGVAEGYSAAATYRGIHED